MGRGRLACRSTTVACTGIVCYSWCVQTDSGMTVHGWPVVQPYHDMYMDMYLTQCICMRFVIITFGWEAGDWIQIKLITFGNKSRTYDMVLLLVLLKINCVWKFVALHTNTGCTQQAQSVKLNCLTQTGKRTQILAMVVLGKSVTLIASTVDQRTQKINKKETLKNLQWLTHVWV